MPLEMKLHEFLESYWARSLVSCDVSSSPETFTYLRIQNPGVGFSFQHQHRQDHHRATTSRVSHAVTRCVSNSSNTKFNPVHSCLPVSGQQFHSSTVLANMDRDNKGEEERRGRKLPNGRTLLPGHGFTDDYVNLFSARQNNGSDNGTNDASARAPATAAATTNASSTAADPVTASFTAAIFSITASSAVATPPSTAHPLTAPRPATGLHPHPAAQGQADHGQRQQSFGQGQAVPWTAEEDQILLDARGQQITYRKIHEVKPPSHLS